MSNNPRIFCFLVPALAVLGACSSGTATKQTKQAPLDRIQGKAQVLEESTGATDAALNAGGPSVYILQGTRRYRLFLRTPVEVVNGKEYVAEGIYAQKAIDEIGDPDQGKNGYPLDSSCEHIVRKAWSNISFDAVDPMSSTLRARVKRYPARALFLLTSIRPATDEEIAAAKSKEAAPAAEDNVPEVSVPADKQRALLTGGPTVQTAPLWEPAGETVSCKVLIGPDGKIAELRTGAQLCESVPWDQFSYQPTVKGGHPVKVATEIEVRFDPRK